MIERQTEITLPTTTGISEHRQHCIWDVDVTWMVTVWEGDKFIYMQYPHDTHGLECACRALIDIVKGRGGKCLGVDSIEQKFLELLVYREKCDVGHWYKEREDLYQKYKSLMVEKYLNK